MLQHAFRMPASFNPQVFTTFADSTSEALDNLRAELPGAEPVEYMGCAEAVLVDRDLDAEYHEMVRIRLQAQRMAF